MEPLSTAVLATPLFGLALSLPVATPPADLRSAVDPSAAHFAPQDDDEESGDLGEDDLGGDDDDLDDFDAELDAALGGGDAGEGELGGGDAYVAQVRERAQLAKIHRAFGIATWAAMGVTLVLGSVQYHNLYGSFAGQSSNPCVEGRAIFGQDQCFGDPWPHLAGALVTAALYTTTFSLSMLMPDPDNAAEGDTDFAKRLRLHKALRWVHLAGMVAQFALGVVIANGDAFGLDRANDYTALQALSTVHLTLGTITWGALTWSGALMGMFD